MKFSYDYSSYSLNDTTEVKTYVYKKGSDSFYTRGSSFLTLSNNGGTKSLTSSKDYNGEYYMVLQVVNINDSSDFCAVRGGVYIDIE